MAEFPAPTGFRHRGRWRRPRPPCHRTGADRTAFGPRRPPRSCARGSPPSSSSSGRRREQSAHREVHEPVGLFLGHLLGDPGGGVHQREEVGARCVLAKGAGLAPPGVLPDQAQHQDADGTHSPRTPRPPGLGPRAKASGSGGGTCRGEAHELPWDRGVRRAIAECDFGALAPLFLEVLCDRGDAGLECFRRSVEACDADACV